MTADEARPAGAERDPAAGGPSLGVRGQGDWRQRAQQRRAAVRRRWLLLLGTVVAFVALAGAGSAAVLWLILKDDDPGHRGLHGVFGEGRTAAPEGLFVDVSVSLGQSCGVRESGELLCWGDDSGVLPSGLFGRVATADGGGCAVRRDGTVACWWEWGSYQLEPWEGPLVGELLDMQAATEYGSADVMGCGVRVDQTLVCWGEDVWFHSGMPEGRFARMAGRGRNRQWCALRTDGEVACWGDWDEHPAPASVPEDLRFADAWLVWGYGCGIELGGATVCWDTGTLEQMEPAVLLDSGRARPSGLPLPDAGLARLARGSAVCAIDADGELRGHCGHEPIYQPDHRRDHDYLTFVEPPSERFTAVALSVGHGCGLLVGGTLACWGYPYGTETIVTAVG